MRRDIPEREQEILGWVESGESKAFICRQLGCKPITLESHLAKLGIEYKGNRGGFGKHSPHRKTALAMTQDPLANSHKLRLRLIEDGVKDHKCEVCERDTWNDQPIPLELHHIDGNRFNNQLGNLTILCPNCHAQTTEKR